MKTDPSCVPQVCKSGRYVILMSGCLFVRSVMHLMCFCSLLVLGSFYFSVLLSEESKFMLLKVTPFITPVILHSSFYQSSPERLVGGWEFVSPCMVTASLGVHFFLKVEKTQFSENVMLIPTSVHFGLRRLFITLGMKLKVLKVEWQHEGRDGEKCWTPEQPFICCPLRIKLANELC